MKSIFKFGGCCVVIFLVGGLGATLFGYLVSRREVRLAQQMMRDVAQLQVEVSTFNDVRAFGQKYNGEMTGTWHDNPCLESNCLVDVTPDQHNFWERHPKLQYAASYIARREWRFHILIWVKDGKLTAVEQWFVYLTPKVSAAVITSVYPPDRGLCGNQFYQLHRTFAANPGPKHFNVWVSPRAIQEKEMLWLNVDCVLRASGCRGVPDMAQAAWRAYEKDQRIIDANGSKSANQIVPAAECR